MRKNNEDSYGVHQPSAEEAGRGYLYVVADGVGGEAAGEAASQLAVETVLREYYATSEKDPPAAIRQAVEAANSAVYASASDRRSTTLVAAAVVEETLHVASVGDSRLYLVRAGHVRQVTQDHSWVQEQVRSGGLDPNAARTHPYGNVITRWLGQPSVEPDLFALPLEEGDRIVICSDGLTRHVEEETIGDLVVRLEPQPAAERLVGLANEGGGTDNVTVVVVAIGDGAMGEGGMGEGIRAADTHSLPVVAEPEAVVPEARPRPASRSGRRVAGWPITCLTLVVLATALAVGVVVVLSRIGLNPELVISVDQPPVALAASAEGVLFAGSRGGRVQVHDLGLADPSNALPYPLYVLGLRRPMAPTTWSVEGAEPITALAVGLGGVHVVAGDRVFVYSRAGEWLRDFAASGDGRLGQPRALAVDTGGRTYLADGARVIRLDSEGRHDPTWTVGSRVDLRAPDALALAPDGGLYVADADSGRVVRLDPNGDLARSWTDVGDLRLVRPMALALAPDGGLYVADVGLRLVLGLDANGAVTFRREELGEPLSLAADGAGNLYVGNAATSRVTVVRPGGSLFRFPFEGTD